jgi:hypothetical protein
VSTVIVGSISLEVDEVYRGSFLVFLLFHTSLKKRASEKNEFGGIHCPETAPYFVN